MTAASDLAHIICTGVVPVPGTVHDPSQPLVLGDIDNNNYVVFTWDEVNHRCSMQAVYQPFGGSLQSTTYTFSYDGKLLINGASLATAIPEIAAAVAAAQASATAAATSAGNALTSENNASTSASAAGSSASDADASAILADQLARAPSGTPIPGGGNSAAVSAQLAGDIAVESRDLDVGPNITADETVQAGHLFTERQSNVAGLVTVTIPPGIFAGPDAKKRWIKYRNLNAAGSIKFQPQAGGTNFVAPTVVARGHNAFRNPLTGAGNRHTLTEAAIVPAVVNGEIIAIFHAAHQSSSNATSVNFSASGGLTWTTLLAYPALPRGIHVPDWFITRAPLVAFAGGTLNLSFDEGVSVNYQAVDWWALEGTSGTTPLFAIDSDISTHGIASALINACPAQARLLAAAAQIGPIGSVAFSTFSFNISPRQTGNSSGIADVAVLDTDTHKNAAFADGDGLTTVAGNTTISGTFTSNAYKSGICAVAYHPKSVIGGGTVVLRKEAGRDTLNVENGVAELWFSNDGVTVDLMTSKP